MTRTDRVWNSSATAGAPAFSDCGTPPHRSSGSEPKRLHHVQNSYAPIGRQKISLNPAREVSASLSGFSFRAPAIRAASRILSVTLSNSVPAALSGNPQNTTFLSQPSQSRVQRSIGTAKRRWCRTGCQREIRTGRPAAILSGRAQSGGAACWQER